MSGEPLGQFQKHLWDLLTAVQHITYKGPTYPIMFRFLFLPLTLLYHNYGAGYKYKKILYIPMTLTMISTEGCCKL